MSVKAFADQSNSPTKKRRRESDALSTYELHQPPSESGHAETSIQASTEDEEATALEEGEIKEVEPPKKKKKRLLPRGGKQWAKKHKGQAATRSAKKAARKAAQSAGEVDDRVGQGMTPADAHGEREDRQEVGDFEYQMSAEVGVRSIGGRIYTTSAQRKEQYQVTEHPRLLITDILASCILLKSRTR
jgi:hypothetical protein